MAVTFVVVINREDLGEQKHFDHYQQMDGGNEVAPTLI